MERRKLTSSFYSIRAKLGEHPRQFSRRVDRKVREMDRVRWGADPKVMKVVILGGLRDQHHVEICMLDTAKIRMDRVRHV